MMSFGKNHQSIVIALLLAYIVFHEFMVLVPPNGSSSTTGETVAATARLSRQRETCELDNLKSLLNTYNKTLAATPFSIDMDSITCHYMGKKFSAQVEFDILESPISQRQSTFMLESMSSNNTSRFMGSVQGRTSLRNTCGVYHATAPIISSSANEIYLYWTSHFRLHSNQYTDGQKAYAAKAISATQNLTQSELEAFMGDERMEFLHKHADWIGGLSLNIPSLQIPIERQQLPDCSHVPISSWHPVGVIQDDSLEMFPNKAGLAKVVPFGSAGCRFGRHSLKELNRRMPSIRVRFLLDSHGSRFDNAYVKFFCGNITKKVLWSKQYRYICPGLDFQMVHRFFRAVYRPDKPDSDFDGITKALRAGDKKVSCQKFLGLGLYNVTVIGMPHWIFAYETNEGMENIVVALESIMKQCSTLYPEEFSRHVFLLQSPTAVDTIKMNSKKETESWRAIQNYRLEQYSQTVAERLQLPMLPFLDLTYARLDSLRRTEKTEDSVHLQQHTYDELFHVLVAGILSEVEAKGLLLKNTNGDPHWFVNPDLPFP